MRITQVDTHIVSLPMEQPLTTALHTVTAVDTVLVTVHTDSGIDGISYLYAFGESRCRVLQAMVEDLGHLLLDEDPHYPERIWKKLWMDLSFLGHAGVAVFGLAALDVAVWDIFGKDVGVPLYKLLGAYRDRVKVCNARGLGLSSTIEELKYDAITFLEEGFQAIKMRVGNENPEEDLARVRAVREAIGDDADLMVDAAQSWTPDSAIQMGRRLEEFNIFWLEEPVLSSDVGGLAKVSATLDVPIAAGHTAFGKEGVKNLVAENAVDVLTPDLQHIGGITEWMKMAAIAEAWGVPIAAHHFPHIHLHLMAAIPNGLLIEHVPWWDVLFIDPPKVEQGFLEATDRPGLGLEVNHAALERYAR